MTPEEARALDRAVAEKVMGMVPCDGWRTLRVGNAGGSLMTCSHAVGTCYPDTPDPAWPGRGVPRYSTDITTAWRILNLWHGDWEIRRVDNWFRVLLSRPSEEYSAFEEHIAFGEFLPATICRAALGVVGGKVL